MRGVRSVVAIPARNEADHLPRCLDAIAAQTVRPDAVLVLVNNSFDGAASMLRQRRAGLPFKLMVREVRLPAGRACAGWARRLAMEAAARVAGGNGVLLATDADGVADAGWLAACLEAIAAGAEAVAGVADIDPMDALAIPTALHEDDARECAYGRQLDEMAALIDPDPFDPWPRHDQHNGASLAVTVQAWQRAGGVPPVRLGEDRAFFAALRRVDARIRHCAAARVVVSGRLVGRAAGGMADTMRRRLDGPDAFLDASLEPAEDARRRLAWRARLRAAWTASVVEEADAEALGLDAAAFRRWMGRPFFGAAWAAVEARSPVLRRRRVPASALAAQAGAAGLILARLRPTDAAGHRAGSLVSAPSA